MNYSDSFSYYSNDVNLERTLLVDSMGSEVGNQIGPFYGTIYWNEDGNIEGSST